MITERRIARSLLAVLAVCGAVFAAAPFALSLLPSARSDAQLPRIAVHDLRPGTFAFVADPLESGPQDGGPQWFMLFVRSDDGKLSVFNVPSVNGRPGVPDHHPWNRGFPCGRFEPDFSLREIRCKDAAPGTYQSSRIWSLDGTSVNNYGPDLDAVRGVEEHGFFVLHKTRRG
jgi:hypothetical protein